MSGSSESNDDLVSGRVNRSNDQTTIWAENKFSSVDIIGIEVNSFRINFSGDAIFSVEVAKDTEEDGEFRPPMALDAIVGNGWSAEHVGGSGGTGVTGIGGNVGGLGVRGLGGENGIGVLGDAGGRTIGVVGLGGPREGTGVFGRGSGGDRLSRRGRGGIGVHGVGGDADLTPGQTAVLPGAGIFGEGGKILDTNENRLLLGAGVIGLGGHAGEKDVPSTNETGSVGLFGQGADAKIEKIFDGGVATLVGPLEPGAGIIGRGGVPTPREMPVAAGVIGLAGGETKPPIDQTGGVGVFGLGHVGVRGSSENGPGVSGRSDNDRGGIFESQRAAQARLVPKKVETRLPEGAPVNPTGINEAALEKGIVSLPKDGAAGDLMALIDDGEDCTLWFCVRGSGSKGPARWAQVLLGSPFDGQSN
ncbi:hypothetical protein [Methylobacter sp. BlB1]|uniref:hypothetical protein n=1 Tax=Methylobacter sp. BlB1 TaxID=2785914 RepID=UPI0018942763|nr:hypothetical protein [Methylobacter sp. BlB1]MBF6651163.1 hypothetical protein [Methylobacter sp. BlB1]